MSTFFETHTTGNLANEMWLPAPASVYRLSVDQYEAMVRSGVFDARDRLHLINGILVAKMTKKPAHVIASEKTRDSLMRTAPVGWRVMVEAPIRIPNFSEPEPDIALAKGTAEDYEEHHPGPGDLALVVEVAESSLQEDRDLSFLYSSAGIQIYWIVNLVDYQVEVYSEPASRGYQSIEIFKPGQMVPLVIQGTTAGHIPVEDLLPRRS